MSFMPSYEEFLDKKINDPTDYSKGKYPGNKYIRKAGFKTKWTRELRDEYLRCSKSVEYFARKYVKIVNIDLGLISIDPYPYQIDMWDSFNDNRFNIVLAARQSGKSIGYVVWILHKAIFTPDYTICIAANKHGTASKILQRVSLALKNLPFFLQPGSEVHNFGSLHFDNGSNIFSAATSDDSIRGDSVNCVILDEFAFVTNDTVFMTSTYPVISSGKTSKIIIVSTPNGIGNEYQKIWSESVNGRNDYHGIRVDWFDVPGRDENWKIETIRNTSKRQFDQEYGLKFYGNSNTLIDGDKLSVLVYDDPIKVFDKIRIYRNPEKDHRYLAFCDVAKGRGLDRSTLTIFDVSTTPFRQVFVFQDSTISPLLLPHILLKWGNYYNEALMVVESNDQGTMVATELHYELEYENLFLSSYQKSDGVGVEVNKKIKSIGCSNLKDLIEEDKLFIADKETISELTTFISKGKSYEAKVGKHDDLVANLWLFSWFVSTDYFTEFFINQDGMGEEGRLSDYIYKEKKKDIEENKLFFGKSDPMDNLEERDLPLM